MLGVLLWVKAVEHAGELVEPHLQSRAVPALRQEPEEPAPMPEPEPLSLQKMQPRAESVPSRLGQVAPASSGIFCTRTPYLRRK